ncbi:hypothetical protein BJ742DRAFT_674204 [Cladochytrium replicatum]|nr:hypothetical protein BJ742DRAFT_674204 [Cladochytrium replicatum]
MTVERTPLPRRGARLQRAVTLNRLLRAKTVGFLGGLSLLVNAMSGPGIPFVPALFQKSGWVLPIFAFVVFTIVSSLSVLFIVEAMQAIPGNKHFQGTVEFGTLINFYFGKKAHLTGQFFLYGALISQAVQSIVLTSQAADDITRRIFGNTWGLVINNGLRWDHSGSGLFDQPVLFTVGYLVTIVLTIPLGFVNLDDNIQIQIGAFFLMFVVLLHWIVASFTSPEVFKPSRLLPIGDELSSVAGVVLLNLAFTVVVPSWINLKRKDVNAQLTVWSATTIMSTLYIIFGIIGAMGYEGLDGDFLKTLRERSNPAAIALASTYAFTFCMLLPGIPVNFQVARQNLTQNRVMGKYPAMFVCFVLPLFIVIPFLRNGSLQAFVDWTSLLFVSTANFVFPLVIYLRCLTFRKDYNASRGKDIKIKIVLEWRFKKVLIN